MSSGVSYEHRQNDLVIDVNDERNTNRTRKIKTYKTHREIPKVTNIEPGCWITTRITFSLTNCSTNGDLIT